MSSSASRIEYSEKYADDMNEYRWVRTEAGEYCPNLFALWMLKLEEPLLMYICFSLW